jgi:succinate dehydrogenase / fumarate reductase cytochrome b subunit
MPSRPTFVSSTVGSKILIGLTGLLLFGFLIGHLAGNLSLFIGADAFNAYAHKLESLGPLLYVVEAGLIGVFLVHIGKTMLNYRRNAAARPAAYAEKKWAGHTSRKSWSSTTMALTGLFILFFVVTHVRTFKFGAWYVDPATGHRDLYRLVDEIYANPLYVGFYVVAMVLIGMHLSHGIASAAQSLGLSNQRYGKPLVIGGRVLAVVIAAGFAVLPLFMFFAS